MLKTLEARCNRPERHAGVGWMRGSVRCNGVANTAGLRHIVMKPSFLEIPAALWPSRNEVAGE